MRAPVVDPGLRWGSQGAKFLVMTLCLGPGGQRSCFGTCFHTRKVKNWGQEGMAPEAPLDPLLGTRKGLL